jgi:endonuclease/exonuclease/phosphatase family metal-dependent hydrolase
MVSRAKLYLSDDDKHDGADDYLGYRDVDVLSTGASVTLTADVRMPSLASSGPAFVLVVVDSERDMTESYESNNVLAIPITIGSDSGPNPSYPYACPSSVFTDASLLSKSTVATLNALRLGWNNNKDMLALACIVSHFDLVGLVEVYTPQGLIDLELELEALTSESWTFHISEYAVGDAYGVEYYAYIWRDAAVTMTGTVGFYDDPGDLIKREPYGANFSMGAIDFTFVVFHLQYGNTITMRRLEAEQLLNVYDYFQLNNGSEQDVLIGGDLNLPADDAAFTLTGVDGMMSITDPEQSTSISSSGLANSFDHIFYPSDFTSELIGSGAHDYTQANWGTVLETVTDHIPVWAELDTSSDDD